VEELSRQDKVSSAIAEKKQDLVMPPAIGHDIQLAIGVEVSDGDSVDVRIGVRSERGMW
jgi:hypothetical protein